MAHDTRGRLARARNAAVMSKVGSFAGAIGVVLVVLGVVGLLTGRSVPGTIAVVVGVLLFVLTVVGARVNSDARHDLSTQQRSLRLRRARYRSAYPRRHQRQHGDPDGRPAE